MISLPETSYGVIPYSKANKLYLIVEQTQGHWSFPKGHRNFFENPVQAARRELKEETNISNVSFEDKTFISRYIHYKGWIPRKKKVVFYLTFVSKQEIEIQEEEILDYTWVTYKEARDLLGYESSKKLIDEVDKYLQEVNAE